MSKKFDIGLNLFSCQKTGRFFYVYFSTFHKIKTSTYIKDLRQSSLQMYVFYRCFKILGLGNDYLSPYSTENCICVGYQKRK